MLYKKNRLSKKKDFENVFQRGKTFKENFLLLKILKSNSDQSRFGFIVSQKISKKATVRNKIKKRISELVRLRIEKLKKGLDVLLISLPGIEEKDFWELGEILDNLFKKAGIKNP